MEECNCPECHKPESMSIAKALATLKNDALDVQNRFKKLIEQSIRNLEIDDEDDSLKQTHFEQLEAIVPLDSDEEEDEEVLQIQREEEERRFELVKAILPSIIALKDDNFSIQEDIDCAMDYVDLVLKKLYDYK